MNQILEQEPSIALIMRDFVVESGRLSVSIRDLKRHLRKHGYYKVGESMFYDALKEMSDAGWIDNIDYLHSIVFFSPTFLSDNAA